ncbi:MAG: peptidase MA family metallohydrolase [Elusimicrobiaceae bacterium]|nr:peptidase MA family metallohydrolase [Elusimicrobiaceae bacterium]
MRKAIMCGLAVLSTAGCVDVPVDSSARRQAVHVAGVELAPGAREKVTLHFLVRAYTEAELEDVGSFCEEQYTKIMRNTGLYSFMPATPYEIIIYSSHEEYVNRSKQPDWSGGVTIGNAILSYNSQAMKSVLAHEMAHLVFNEYMSRSDYRLVWLNEGLAVYTQIGTYGDAGQASYNSAVRAELLASPIPFARMMSYVPMRDAGTNGGTQLSRWYGQAGSVAEYMIERGGSMGFSMLLRELKNGAGIDSALASAYPGKWSDTAALEAGWLAYLKGQ